MSNYGVLEKGAPSSTDYHMYITGPSGTPVSPFHDIPLFTNADRTEFNMVVEIPRWTNAKMEISTSKKLNPLVQDVKKGKLRYVDNVFPFNGYIWNYGALPQTWEDPNVEVLDGCKGDNDPLDVCELGSKVHKRGAVVRVKALGVLGLIDEGETDWKVMVVDVEDPLAEKLNSLEDIERVMPGYLEATRRWFKVYKMPQGKDANAFAFGGEFKDRDYAHSVIQGTHKHWQDLVGMTVEAKNIACENVSVAGSPFLITRDDAKKMVDGVSATAGQSEPVPPSLDTWHFVQG